MAGKTPVEDPRKQYHHSKSAPAAIDQTATPPRSEQDEDINVTRRPVSRSDDASVRKVQSAKPLNTDDVSTCSSEENASVPKVQRAKPLSEDESSSVPRVQRAKPLSSDDASSQEASSREQSRSRDGDVASRKSEMQASSETPQNEGRPEWAGAPRNGWHHTAPVRRDTHMAAPQVQLALVSDRLDIVIAPGDVLCVKGNGRLMEIGRAGGFMGHVMVVVRPPRAVRKDSSEAVAYENAWPADAAEIWVLRTVESTRSQQGLYEVETLLYVQPDTGKLLLLGEITVDDEIGMPDVPEPLELWQSPAALRAHLCPHLMVEVVNDMKAQLASWSATTAARAVGVAAWMGSRNLSGSNGKVLDDMMVCWSKEPICTSVVIIFWQMYLCKFAPAVNAGRPQSDQINAADMIMKYMPLKADRVLPGQLMKTMEKHGFIGLSRMPKMFKSMAVPVPVPVAQPAPLVPGPQQSSEELYAVGEHVLYWSDSMGQWIDASIQGQHLDSNGLLVGYDLNVKPWADATKIKRPPQLHSEAPAQARAHSGSSESQTPTPRQRPSQPASTPPREALEERVAKPRENAAALSAMIAAAIAEGWFSCEDVDRAVLASGARKPSGDSVAATAEPKCSVVTV